MNARGLVIQSHRQPLPYGWLEPCLASVEHWAALQDFDYQFLADELFDCLDPELLDHTAGRSVVATDLARLHRLQSALEHYPTVVWCDADFLIHRPEQLILPEDDYGVGREVWVQKQARGLRAHVQVHNAFLFFRRGNPFLGFYLHAAERIVRAHLGPMTPQLVGPKLLTALHNIMRLPVVETAAMLCPLAARELMTAPGPALQLIAKRSSVVPAGLNLCGSLCGASLDGMTHEDMSLLVARMVQEPWRLQF